ATPPMWMVLATMSYGRGCWTSMVIRSSSKGVSVQCAPVRPPMRGSVRHAVRLVGPGGERQARVSHLEPVEPDRQLVAVHVHELVEPQVVEPRLRGVVAVRRIDDAVEP